MAKKNRRRPAKAAPPPAALAPRARENGPRLAPLAAAAALLAIVAYANAFQNSFALDDVRAIVENPIIRDFGNLGRIFRTNYWDTGVPGVTALDPGLYRPLTVLTYMVDYRLWGLDPTGFHAVNIVLHAASTALVFVLAVDIVGSAMAAFAAAAVFAVHPIHTDAVASVVGRAEILATLFFLGAF